jgi:hypothetical protein
LSRNSAILGDDMKWVNQFIAALESGAKKLVSLSSTQIN